MSQRLQRLKLGVGEAVTPVEARKVAGRPQRVEVRHPGRVVPGLVEPTAREGRRNSVGVRHPAAVLGSVALRKVAPRRCRALGARQPLEGRRKALEAALLFQRS